MQFRVSGDSDDPDTLISVGSSLIVRATERGDAVNLHFHCDIPAYKVHPALPELTTVTMVQFQPVSIP
jgi:hypothetical protein